MNTENFTQDLNKICKENNNSIIFHKTKTKNLESILKSGGIFSVGKIMTFLENFTLTFFNFGQDGITTKNQIEKYKKNLFVSLKSPLYSTQSNEIFGKDFIPITFIINPLDLNEDILIDSNFCASWEYGKFNSKNCVKYNPDKNLQENLKRYENYLYKKYTKLDKSNFSKESKNFYKRNELVIRHPNGIIFDEIFRKNSNGVIIVVESSLINEVDMNHIENLSKIYTNFKWVFLK